MIPIIQENSRNVNSTGQNHKVCLFFPIIAACGKKDGKNPFLHNRSAGKEKFGNICLMSFYTVVSGWILYYFYSFVTGKTADLGFVNMISDPGVNVTFMLIAVAVGFAVLCFKLQGGLERSLSI